MVIYKDQAQFSPIFLFHLILIIKKMYFTLNTFAGSDTQQNNLNKRMNGRLNKSGM